MNDVTTPAPEVIEQKDEPVVEVPVVETIGDIVTPKDAVPKVESVPMARLNKEITRRKELEAKVASLEAKASSMSDRQIDKSIQELAAEHNVDPEFLDKFAASVRSQLEQSFDEKLRPITDKEKAVARDAKFTEVYNKTLGEMPEFKDVADMSVIRQLALNPANATKTFPELMEETYGRFVQGKRSIESTVPRGGNAPAALDYAKASNDKAYFKEVMADPKLKAEYNAEMLRRY